MGLFTRTGPEEPNREAMRHFIHWGTRDGEAMLADGTGGSCPEEPDVFELPRRPSIEPQRRDPIVLRGGSR